MTTKTTYCAYEGHPAVLTEYDDGHMDAAIYTAGGEWISAHPADLAMGGAVMTKAAFDEKFGHLPPRTASQ